MRRRASPAVSTAALGKYDDGVEVTDELRQRWKESGERMRKLREAKNKEAAKSDDYEDPDDPDEHKEED